MTSTPDSQGESQRTEPLVTVIVPVYNTAAYLRKCLDSILNQTYHNLEILCVDDGSKDDSLLILNEYKEKDKRVRVWHQQNAGQGAARNLALDHARGEFISSIDSDDYIEPNTYEELIPLMKHGIDLLNFGVKVSAPQSPAKESMERYLSMKSSGEVPYNADLISDLPGIVANKILRRSIIEQYNIRFPHGLWYEDSIFCYMYASVCKNVYFELKQYYVYQLRTDSTMGKTKAGNKKALDMLEGASIAFAFFKQHGLWEHQQRTIKGLAWSALERAASVPEKYQMLATRLCYEWVLKWNLHEEFPNLNYITKHVRNAPPSRFLSLFYRRTISSVAYCFFGLPIYSKQMKNGMKVYRLFGIQVYSKQKD